MGVLIQLSIMLKCKNRH